MLIKGLNSSNGHCHLGSAAPSLLENSDSKERKADGDRLVRGWLLVKAPYSTPTTAHIYQKLTPNRSIVASLLRMSHLEGLKSDDITFTAVPAVLWSVAEVTIAIVCANVPSMRPLVSRYLPKLKISFFRGHLATSPRPAHGHGNGVEPATAFELAQYPTGPTGRPSAEEDDNESQLDLYDMLRIPRRLASEGDAESRPVTPSESQVNVEVIEAAEQV